MTFEEFNKKFNRHSAFDRYFSLVVAISFIGFSMYLLASMFTHVLLKFPDGKAPGIFMVIVLLATSLYILSGHSSRFKITIWENQSTKEENIEKIKLMMVYLGISENRLQENFTSIVYKTGTWNPDTYHIYLFAGNNFIAINIRNLKGWGNDFGQSKRLLESLEIFSYDIKLQE